MQIKILIFFFKIICELIFCAYICVCECMQVFVYILDEILLTNCELH